MKNFFQRQQPNIDETYEIALAFTKECENALKKISRSFKGLEFQIKQPKQPEHQLGNMNLKILANGDIELTSIIQYIVNINMRVKLNNNDKVEDKINSLMEIVDVLNLIAKENNSSLNFKSLENFIWEFRKDSHLILSASFNFRSEKEKKIRDSYGDELEG